MVLYHLILISEVAGSSLGSFFRNCKERKDLDHGSERQFGVMVKAQSA